jgi:hypothetical protein
MKKSELKEVLKPLIKECIKEVIFEEGVLSGVISEVMKGTATTQVVAEAKVEEQKAQLLVEQQKHQDEVRNKIRETKEKMLEAIGNETYNGVNLFEGTAPLKSGGNPAAKTAAQSPLSKYAPDDQGVDISKIFSSKWKDLV